MMRMKNTMTRSIKRYSELIKLNSFDDRYDYVRVGGIVGDVTFGNLRYLNQMLYTSVLWKEVRRRVILRDDGLDLGHPDYPIIGSIYIHHLNPITADDILNKSEIVFDPEFLISTSLNTHNALHYGDRNGLLAERFAERLPNDTVLW